MKDNAKFTMVGTEGTGEYVGLATDNGQVGFRDLGGGEFRVRVEPAAGREETLAPHFPGWKTGIGGKEFRYSTVVSTGETGLRQALTQALTALLATGEVSEVSQGCPAFVSEIASSVKAKPQTVPVAEVEERTRLIAEVKRLKVPGCNFASKWTLATLREKVAQAKA